MIVEGDRGEDMGIVVAMAPRDSPMLATIFTACASTMGRNNPGWQCSIYCNYSNPLNSNRNPFLALF